MVGNKIMQKLAGVTFPITAVHFVIKAQLPPEKHHLHVYKLQFRGLAAWCGVVTSICGGGCTV